MRIVFLGTPDFAAVSLEALVRAGYTPAAVVTQPDRKSGRGKQLLPPAVKVTAEQYGIPVYQFERISKEGVECLKELQPDLMITAAFGQILSQEILDIPPLGCVNVHASLLPRYRGAAPIQWAILNGEKVTGVTTMYTKLALDAGDMILKREEPILPTDTAGSLFDKLAVLGGEVLIDTVKLIEQGEAPRIPQNEAEATKCGMITKEMGNIDWSEPGEVICRKVRAFAPWPGAFTFYQGQMVKIWECACTDQQANTPGGTVILANAKDGLQVASGDVVLDVTEIQPAGSRRMTAKEYLRARTMEQGGILVKEP